MGCCKGFLVMLNTLVLVVGMGVSGVGIYLVVEASRGSDILGPDAPTWAGYVPIVLGVIIMIMAGIGCCISMGDSKCMLGLYGFMLLVIAIILIVAGSALVLYANYVQDIADTAVLNLSGGLGDAKFFIYSYMLGTYVGCCPPGLAQAPQPCPTVNTDASNELEEYCYQKEDSFNVGNTNDQAVCDVFADGGDLGWCPATTDTTADNGAGVRSFLVDASDYAQSNILPAGIAVIVFGAILFLACIAACHLSCRTNKEKTPKQSSNNNAQSSGAPRTAGQNVTMA